MLSIQYASKLLIGRRARTADWSKIIRPAAPVLALCGDIGSPFCERTASFIRWTGANWDKVLWVPGIEEWATPENTPHTMAEVPAAMATVCDSRVQPMINSHWLHRGRTSYQDVLFLGTTLWGPCRIGKEAPPQATTLIGELGRLTYRPIGQEIKRRVQPQQIQAANKKAITWLAYQIDDSRDEDKARPVVVLTYNAPTFDSLGVSDRYDIARLPMRNMLDELLIRPVHTWLYGDVNRNFSMMNEATGVYLSSNSATCPVGYGTTWTTQVKADDPVRWFPPVSTSTLLSTAPSLALPFDEE